MPDDLEATDADAIEQRQPADDPEAVVTGREAPFEADEGDLVESSLEVPLDDDDRR